MSDERNEQPNDSNNGVGIIADGNANNDSDSGNGNATSDGNAERTDGNSFDGGNIANDVSGQSDGDGRTLDVAGDEHSDVVDSTDGDEFADDGSANESEPPIERRRRINRERQRERRAAERSGTGGSGHAASDGKRTDRATAKSKRLAVETDSLKEPKQVSFDSIFTDSSSDSRATAKTKRTATKSKSLLSLDETKELLTWAFFGIAQLGFGEHWELSADEADLLSEKTQAVLQQFPASVVNKYGKTFEKFMPCVSLLLTASFIIAPRIKETQVRAQNGFITESTNGTVRQQQQQQQAENGFDSARRNVTPEVPRGGNGSVSQNGNRSDSASANLGNSQNEVSKFFGNF